MKTRGVLRSRCRTRLKRRDKDLSVNKEGSWERDIKELDEEKKELIRKSIWGLFNKRYIEVN